MINEKNTIKKIATVTARINIEKPELFTKTLRNNANNPYTVLESQNEVFIVCRPINPDITFTISINEMNNITCNGEDDWYSLYFDPQEKSLEDATSEFLAFAKKFYSDKKEELLRQARELEKAISNLPLTDLS